MFYKNAIYTVVTQLDATQLNSSWSNYDKCKVLDKYLIHYKCGYCTRNKELIEKHYCEKCNKCLDDEIVKPNH